MKKINLITSLLLATLVFKSSASDKSIQKVLDADSMACKKILNLAKKRGPSAPLTNPDFSYTSRDSNTQCNASVTSQGFIISNVLQECSFQGGGCPICFATAQILEDVMKGKTSQEVLDFSLESLLALIEIRLIPSRKKCPATFLDALKTGIHLYLQNRPV